MAKRKTKLLKEATVKKDNLDFYYDLIDQVKTTNGDLFKITRQVQDDGVNNGYDVTNLSEIYFWLKDYRDK